MKAKQKFLEEIIVSTSLEMFPLYILKAGIIIVIVRINDTFL
jgi:hypothetical protein